MSTVWWSVLYGLAVRALASTFRFKLAIGPTRLLVTILLRVDELCFPHRLCETKTRTVNLSSLHSIMCERNLPRLYLFLVNSQCYALHIHYITKNYKIITSSVTLTVAFMPDFIQFQTCRTNIFVISFFEHVRFH